MADSPQLDDDAIKAAIRRWQAALEGRDDGAGGPHYVDALREVHRVLAAFDRPLVRVCASRLGTIDRGRDAAQEVMTRALVKLPEFDTEAARPFAAWIFTIARYVCLQFGRPAKEGLTEAGVADTEDDVRGALRTLLREERHEIVELALADLDEELADLIRLRMLEGQTPAYIAKTRPGYPDARAVTVQIFRAKRHLRNVLSKLLADRGHGPSFLHWSQ